MTAVLAVPVLAAGVPDPMALAQATSSGLLLGGLFALTALGLSLVLGVMRLVNLVHGELVVLGAYLAFWVSDAVGVDPLIATPLVALLAAALAWPLQRTLLQPLARHGEEAPLITTFALSVIAQNLLILVFHGDTRSIDRPYTRAVVHVGALTVPAIHLVAFAVSMAVCAAVHVLVARTGFGRRLRAASEDADAAAVVGVRVGGLHARTYALAGAVAGLGGALVGMCFSFTPTSGTEYLLTGFAVVVLGGLGSVKGTVLGGIGLGLVESWGAVVAGDGYRLFVGLVVLIVFLAVRPQGLFGRAAT
jgi:branched-chain amino acid transport system permease protein